MNKEQKAETKFFNPDWRETVTWFKGNFANKMRVK